MKQLDATSRFGLHLLASLLLAAWLPRAFAAPEIPAGDLAKIQQAADRPDQLDRSSPQPAGRPGVPESGRAR